MKNLLIALMVLASLPLASQAHFVRGQSQHRHGYYYNPRPIVINQVNRPYYGRVRTNNCYRPRNFYRTNNRTIGLNNVSWIIGQLF